jgi:hypothetical protein
LSFWKLILLPWRLILIPLQAAPITKTTYRKKPAETSLYKMNEILVQHPRAPLKVGVYNTPRAEDNERPAHQRAHVFEMPEDGTVPASFSALPLHNPLDAPGLASLPTAISAAKISEHLLHFLKVCFSGQGPFSSFPT